MILPGSTLGLLGGGQLGRFFVIAAREAGYRVLVLDPDPFSPAGDMANEHVCADYDDASALERLASECEAVTTEFENMPADTMRMLSGLLPISPSPKSVITAQNRLLEKQFIVDLGLPTTPFAAIHTPGELKKAGEQITFPAILKRATFGYDGKGQIRVGKAPELQDAFDSLDQTACILEEQADLDREISIVLARTAEGEMVHYPIAENEHRDGVLAVSTIPAKINNTLSAEAISMARQIATALDYCGVLAVEFFITRAGALLINEIAPRPHNSGHFTLDACVSSQFEQQLRTLCGLPLGDPRLLSPVSMVNLLGDRWLQSESIQWSCLFDVPGACLHLYGKREARPKRKMGHFCVLAETPEAAEQRARKLDTALLPNLSGQG